MDKRDNGCGFAGYEGKSRLLYELGATAAPHNRTCPMYYWRQDAIQQILSDVRDYERAALGCVFDLEPQYLELLRIAESERKAWESEQTRQLSDK